MIEPSCRTRGSVPSFSSEFFKAAAFNTKKEDVMVFNKAFSSLSFRGKRGYPTNIVNKSKKAEKTEKAEKAEKTGRIGGERGSTYGAILKIEDENGETQYALVRGRYTGKWSFPKGHSNVGETSLECTMREVAEETGIDILPEPTEYVQIGYGNYYVFNLKKKLPLEARDTHEVMDTKWMTIEEMNDTALNADASQFVKKLTKGEQ
jgi:ADP-ribose pyrophosphatase YjhB (NUDIX family)